MHSETQNVTTPLVSIGLPIYNEERYVGRVIDSLLAQDHENFELIILDNASEDATPRICEEYAAKDQRIRYSRNKSNIGSLGNFNKALKLSRGEYFMWASGHDLRHPSFLSRCVEVMEADPSVVLCHPQTVWIDEAENQLDILPDFVDTRGFKERWLKLNVVLWGIVTGYPIYGLLRTSALRQTYGLAKVWSPDITLLIELSLLGAFAHIREPLLYARRQPDYKNWGEYIEKHFQKSMSGWQAQVLFWRMLRRLLKIVTRHTDSSTGKVIGVFSVLICMLTKYRWVFTALLSIKRNP